MSSARKNPASDQSLAASLGGGASESLVASEKHARSAARFGRRRLLAALVAVSVLGAWDLGRSPDRQWTAHGLLWAIDSYQATLSPVMPRLGVQCRFRPTCSVYGETVIRRHGALAGLAKAARRVLRCGPWTPAGTVDPP